MWKEIWLLNQDKQFLKTSGAWGGLPCDSHIAQYTWYTHWTSRYVGKLGQIQSLNCIQFVHFRKKAVFTKHLYVKSIHKNMMNINKFCDIQCVNLAPFFKYLWFQWSQGKYKKFFHILSCLFTPRGSQYTCMYVISKYIFCSCRSLVLFNSVSTFYFKSTCKSLCLTWIWKA